MGNTTVKRSALELTNAFREWIFLGICLICMFLFLFSAYEKIIGYEQFLNGLKKVSFVSQFAKVIAWAVPLIEILTSILLIIPKTQKWGLYGFAGTMAVFSFYILSMLLLKDTLPCHCNLIIDKLTWSQHLWFNLAFIGLALSAIRFNKSNYKS